MLHAEVEQLTRVGTVQKGSAAQVLGSSLPLAGRLRSCSMAGTHEMNHTIESTVVSPVTCDFRPRRILTSEG